MSGSKRGRNARRERKKKINMVVEALMKRFDEDGTGELNAEEVQHMMVELNNGVQPDATDVAFVMKTADKNQSGTLDSKQVRHALKLWKFVSQERKKLEALFDKFDQNKDTQLDRNEVKMMLNYLNGGVPVPESDVDKVFNNADTKTPNGAVDREELVIAVKVWYATFDEQQDKLQKKYGICFSFCVPQYKTPARIEPVDEDDFESQRASVTGEFTNVAEASPR